jgi:hypothetical protein
MLFMAALSILGLGVTDHCRAEEPGIDSARSKTVQNGRYAQYPVTFDGRGVLDALTDDTVTVSDSQFSLAPTVSFNLPGWIGVSRTRFEAGQFVAYKLNEKKEVVSLWVLQSLTDLEAK